MLAVENESDFLKGSNHIAAEVLQSDVAIAFFHRRDIHDVDADNPTRLRHAMQAGDDVREVFIKLLVVDAVAEVAV